MTAIILQIADAIVTKLNSVTYSPTFTATRKNAPDFNVGEGELDSLTVVVFPSGMPEDKQITRGKTFDTDYSVHIGILKEISGFTNTITDPLINVACDILDDMRGDDLTLSGGDTATYFKSENDPIMDDDQARTELRFLSVIALTYKVFRKMT